MSDNDNRLQKLHQVVTSLKDTKLAALHAFNGCLDLIEESFKQVQSSFADQDLLELEDAIDELEETVELVRVRLPRLAEAVAKVAPSP